MRSGTNITVKEEYLPQKLLFMLEENNILEVPTEELAQIIGVTAGPKVKNIEFVDCVSKYNTIRSMLLEIKVGELYSEIRVKHKTILNNE